jgi:CxxC motif-containing protein
MNSKTNYICVTCPVGCSLQVEHHGRNILKVEGNQCKKGLQYAESEHHDPRRMLTTTVKVRGGFHPLVPVQTKSPIPKSMIFDIIEKLRRIEITAPVRIGQIVMEDAMGTGIDIIASRDLPAKNS